MKYEMKTEEVKYKKNEKYKDNAEEGLRFVDIKSLLDEYKAGDELVFHVTGYTIVSGYQGKPNILLFIGEREALSFSTQRTTGKSIIQNLKKTLSKLEVKYGENAESILRGAEAIYTLKILNGLSGNYFGLVSIEFTGNVSEKTFDAEISGDDKLLQMTLPEFEPEEEPKITVISRKKH